LVLIIFSTFCAAPSLRNECVIKWGRHIIYKKTPQRVEGGGTQQEALRENSKEEGQHPAHIPGELGEKK